MSRNRAIILVIGIGLLVIGLGVLRGHQTGSSQHAEQDRTGSCPSGYSRYMGTFQANDPEAHILDVSGGVEGGGVNEFASGPWTPNGRFHVSTVGPTMCFVDDLCVADSAQFRFTVHYVDHNGAHHSSAEIISLGARLTGMALITRNRTTVVQTRIVQNAMGTGYDVVFP